MRIKNSGRAGGTPPIDDAEETQKAESATPTSSLDRSRATSSIGSTGAVHDPRAASLASDVTRRLRAGEITPREAVELLIDDAVGRQVGRLTADRATLAAELKELLRRYTETDPYLASRVRRLGNKT